MATMQLRPMAMGEILDASFALLRRHGCGARAAPRGDRRPGSLLGAHQGVPVAGVRTLGRGVRAPESGPDWVRRHRRSGCGASAGAVRAGAHRRPAHLLVLLSVHELCVHLVILRPARAEGGVRSRAAEPAPRHHCRAGVSIVPQQVESDSLRAALRAVFQAREYRWSEPSSAWLLLTEQRHRLLDWLETLRVAAPARYYLLLAAMTLVLLAILTHLTCGVWRSLRPRPAVGVPSPDTAPPQGAAWHLAEARRLGAAGRFAEALAHRFP